MAEGNGEDEDPYSFRNYSLKKDRKPSEDGDERDDSYLKPDLGIGDEPSFENNGENYVSGEQHANAANEHPKREENPFSFKHFLKRDPGSGYQSTGARPKVFSNHHNDSHSHLDTVSMDSVAGTSRNHIGTSEYTSVLPDFVQDHLVVEQCYLNHSDLSCGPQLGVSLENLENLPDFAINSSPDMSRSRLWNDHMSTVLNVGGDSPSSHEAALPLDLPGDFGLPSFLPSPTQSNRLPFDLPLAGEAETANVETGTGVSKSLPDFLSDGPIYGGRLVDDPAAGEDSLTGDGDVELAASRDQVQKLKQRLEDMRRQLLDKTLRVHALEKELVTIRSKDHVEMAILEKAIEQVEDNLKRSTRRAVTAESTVSKLKQEMKLLTKELTELRQENCTLRFCSGGAGASSSTGPDERQAQRLAQDLRAAAGTAEQSLRSLLTGVGNLRVIASTLENLNRMQDQTEDYLEDHQDDDSGGPPL